MGDRLSAERACKDPNPIIDGRKANVNLAILGAKPRGNLTQGEFSLLEILAGHPKVEEQFFSKCNLKFTASHERNINNLLS